MYCAPTQAVSRPAKDEFYNLLQQALDGIPSQWSCCPGIGSRVCGRRVRKMINFVGASTNWDTWT